MREKAGLTGGAGILNNEVIFSEKPLKNNQKWTWIDQNGGRFFSKLQVHILH